MSEPPDKEAWQAKRDTFHQQLLTLTQDCNATLFFGDEAGFEGDPRPRQRWANEEVARPKDITADM